MFIDPGQAPRKHIGLILGQVESLHQLSDSHVFFGAQPVGWCWK